MTAQIKRKKGFEPKNLDIMGRKLCSSIMPCYVCRCYNKYIPKFPKGELSALMQKYEVSI